MAVNPLARPFSGRTATRLLADIPYVHEPHLTLLPPLLSPPLQVQDDIASQLRLREPLRLLSSFNRPNIAYTVRWVGGRTGPTGPSQCLRSVCETY